MDNFKNSFLGKQLQGRNAPPSHYTVKIQCFSTLSKSSVERYTTEQFEAGGYKWKLHVYPNGNKKRQGQDHISLYIELMETSTFAAGWEVKAIVNVYTYNHLQDKYVGTQDITVRRFHQMKIEWGATKFMDLETFNNPSNGYIDGDTCVFGAEIFVVKSTSKGECLALTDNPISFSHTWVNDNYSRKTSLVRYESETFVGGEYKWKLLFYPNGCNEGTGNSISLFLSLESSTLPANAQLYVRYILRLRHQMDGKHHEFEATSLFTHSLSDWGTRRYMSLTEFKDASSGFLVEDKCILEVQLIVLGSLKPL